jgi:RimJ/RimL family protein N-acetyltransferase
VIANTIPAALAAERRQDLLDRADAYRLAKQARDSRHGLTGGPGPVGRWLGRLRTASVVRIRPIRPDDAARIREAFARLSEESRRLRFLGPKNGLSPAELRYFTEVDHHSHEALVAVSRFTGRGLGVVRYVRDPHDREVADVAVTVIDEWQARGLGTELMDRLAERARCEGVHRFTALISTDNRAARRMLGKSGTATLVRREGSTLAYDIALAPSVRERRALRWYVLGPAPAECAGI